MSRLAIALALLLASGIALPAHAADPAETPVAVLTRAIARGDILSATDFELQPRTASRPLAAPAISSRPGWCVAARR